MSWSTVDFSAFPHEREVKLRSIKRYSMFSVMLYRSHLWIHSHRVHWIVEALTADALRTISFDPEKARVLALVHDDAEMVTGDIQAGHKAKMSAAELAALEEDEERAIDKLVAEMPREIGGYSYGDLLRHAVHKDCIEAQLVSYADRVDAYCETLHEILAGNIAFVWSLLLYERWMSAYATKYPALAPYLTAGESPFVIANAIQQPRMVVPDAFVRFGRPHTRESLTLPSDFPYYDAWRALVSQRGGEEGIAFLATAQETLPQPPL